MVRDENHIPEAIFALDEAAADAVEETAKQMAEQIDRGFDTGQDALGRPWQPLAAETIRRKGHSTILVDSGEMRESFGVEFARSTKTARVGSNDEKVPYHEWGVPERNLPARPMLGPAAKYAEHELLDDVFAAAIGQVFADFD